MTVQADVTLAMPILISALSTTVGDALSKRKRIEFDVSGRHLVVNGHVLPDRYLES